MRWIAARFGDILVGILFGICLFFMTVKIAPVLMPHSANLTIRTQPPALVLVADGWAQLPDAKVLTLNGDDAGDQ